jgi:hypothetical protein
MNTTIKVIIVVVLFGLPLCAVIHCVWVLHKNAKDRNQSGDLP